MEEISKEELVERIDKLMEYLENKEQLTREELNVIKMICIGKKWGEE